MSQSFSLVDYNYDLALLWNWFKAVPDFE